MGAAGSVGGSTQSESHARRGGKKQDLATIEGAAIPRM
jgi:hypothetical protein